MATANIEVSETPLVLYALRRADDALILGHRLSEWCGHEIGRASCRERV